MADLKRLEIRAGASVYPVVVGRGALSALPGLLESGRLGGRPRVVVDERIAQNHGASVVEVLRSTGSDVAVLAISGAEHDKNLVTVSQVYDWLVETGTDRSDLLLAVGGGVVGDLVGFAAATYLRGIRLVHVPTTLLAMVDSSVGGKTGVDHPAGKNLIGAFHQPSAIVAELSFLDTLPRREVAAGWAEVVKMGIIASADLFELFERDTQALLRMESGAEWAIARSIELKGEVVAADEREAALRMILNYGHTIGHAIEAATGYGRYLHGEAVAIGMRAAAELASRLGLFDAESVARQAAVLGELGLPDRSPGISIDELWRPLRRDKKAVGGQLRWVLPNRIGAVEVRADVPDDLIDQVLREVVRN